MRDIFSDINDRCEGCNSYDVVKKKCVADECYVFLKYKHKKSAKAKAEGRQQNEQ